MSFISNLEIEGNSYKVLHSSFNFNQSVGSNLKPSGKPQGGILNVTLELDKNTDFFYWMINSSITKDGSLVFYNRDAMSRQITLDFTNAFCTNLTGVYDAHNNEPLKISLSIVAETININNEVEHINNWNGNV